MTTDNELRALGIATRCECDLRNRRWNPNTGRCESCGCRYEQPRSVPNDSTPIDLVIADLRERAEVGRERYGVYLQANNGRDPTQDAYEEVLDLAKYVRQWREERRQLMERVAVLEAALRDALTKIDVYVPEVVRYKGIGNEVRALYDVLDATGGRK